MQDRRPSPGPEAAEGDEERCGADQPSDAANDVQYGSDEYTGGHPHDEWRVASTKVVYESDLISGTGVS